MSPTAKHELNILLMPGEPHQYRGRCLRCGHTTPTRDTRQEVEDDFREHQANVLRGIGHGPASSKQQRDWFERCAADESRSAKERQEWQRLADELTRRLGDRRPEGEQLDLLSSQPDEEGT